MIFCLDLRDALRCSSVVFTYVASSRGADELFVVRCFLVGGVCSCSSSEEEAALDESDSESEDIAKYIICFSNCMELIEFDFYG